MPAPLGPTSPSRERGPSVRSTWSRTVRAPNERTTPWSEIRKEPPEDAGTRTWRVSAGVNVWVSSSPSWAGAEALRQRTTSGREAPRAPTSEDRASSSACVCGSTFRSLPQTGQRPAQSGACRIWSGSASAIASRAHAESSSWSSTTYSLRSSTASPGSFAWYSRASIETSTTASVRQRMHGPCRRTSNASRRSRPVVACTIVSSLSTSCGTGRYRSPPSSKGSSSIETASRCSSPGRSRRRRSGKRVTPAPTSRSCRLRARADSGRAGRRRRRPSPASARAAARGRASRPRGTCPG